MVSHSVPCFFNSFSILEDSSAEKGVLLRAGLSLESQRLDISFGLRFGKLCFWDNSRLNLCQFIRLFVP